MFEPASTIKVIAHLYAMQQIQNGSHNLDESIVRYNYGPNSCPGTNTAGTEPLRTALREMMHNSDNTRTRAVVDTFGRVNIDNNAAAIGMASTSINHVLGCGGPPANTLTLADAGKLYEGVANGTLLDADHRATFFELMAGKAYDFSGTWGKAQTIINQEAPAGMTAAQKDSFKQRIAMSYKAGGYTYCTSGGCATTEEYRSIAGIATIPFCNNHRIELRQYLFGIFIDKATNGTNANNTFANTEAEPLREQLNTALSSWAPCSSQVFVPVSAK